MSKKPVHPPYLAKKLLSFMRHYSEEYSCVGDLVEEYREIARERGKCIAYLWYWWQVLYAIPTYILLQIEFGGTMFKNYFKIALRNMKKHKSFSFINIAGLAFGIACSLLIFRYVIFEMSYDNYHKDADRIYRINMNMKHQNRETNESRFDLFVPKIPAPHIGHIREEIPNIEKAVCITKGGPALVSREDKRFYEDEYMYIDPEVFNIFTIPFVQGNPKSALERPNTVVVTQRIAEKYFGNNQILDEDITIDGDT